MRIKEILRIPSQNFPIRNVRQLLSYATDNIGYIDEKYMVNYLEYDDERFIILTNENDIVAYAGFISRLNGKVWQAKNIEVYGSYKGNNIGAKIYKFVKDKLKHSIQSDIEQTKSSEILWTSTLPSIGLHPKIFDTETQYIIDQSYPEKYKEVLSKMYTNDEDDPDKYRYTWILEKNDFYREHCILTENRLLLPYTGFWYTFK